jgi:hypothetical protein
MGNDVEAHSYAALQFSDYFTVNMAIMCLKRPLPVFRYSVSCGTGGASMKAMLVVKGVLTCTLHPLMLEL